ncbi:flagellar biosynthesis protein FlhB [Mixta tenebrionis]|uniref:Flagellar biosynthetic protein FlhB n=1 Tax=Mixta tenebrionis TaxID=2562439 RepID=A0A506V4S5_9GAMM|nr:MULTISPECIES: flagellar biosynthesis protein FlhB [Mixta]QHM77484.1 Flagellar biosynthetic protein FlhB [Mixta theicola]TPW40655.1 flagellar type III secretion system protein FlhB [Mixta tenebrionis]
MSEESDVEKTEDPTPYRREKARKEGQIPRSKELTSVMMLLVGWSLMLAGGHDLVMHLTNLLHDGLTFDALLARDTSLLFWQLRHLSNAALQALLLLLPGLFLTALTTPMLLGGLHLGGKSLKLDLKRLSPISGLKRMFSAQVVSELLKGILKVTLVGCVCGLYLYLHRQNFIHLVEQPLYEALHNFASLIMGCLLMVILALIPMVGYDVFWQLFSNLKKLRMSRQEIRDEHKEHEGDPHVKGRIKQLQRAAATRRMMAELPNADVIINNPTHYSVALRYQEGSMAAPILLAKGAGETALRIRAVAGEHRIPMLEAPPLARALYRHCELNAPIPAALYGAVAEVLAWVYSLRRWRHAGGLRPKKPVNLPVPAALDFTPKSQE